MPDVTTVELHSSDDILNQLSGLIEECDYVIADGPGSNSEISRARLLRADLALVPCKASILEIRALALATEVVRQAQDIRSGMPDACIILTMVREQFRLVNDMREAAKTLGFRMTRHSLTLRQIYADAPGQGSVVWNMPTPDQTAKRKANAEIIALFTELFFEIGKKKRISARHSVTRKTPTLTA